MIFFCKFNDVIKLNKYFNVFQINYYLFYFILILKNVQHTLSVLARRFF
jgi:hypothetical protein